MWVVVGKAINCLMQLSGGKQVELKVQRLFIPTVICCLQVLLLKMWSKMTSARVKPPHFALDAGALVKLPLNVSLFSFSPFLSNRRKCDKILRRWKTEVKLTRHDGWDEEKLPGEGLWDFTTSCFCLSKMAKNEICAKVSKNLNTNVFQQSQSIQQYCNIAGDILVWDFLPPCLLFKTPRTQWFDNDLIARYFQFEYSEAAVFYRFFTKNHHAWSLYKLYFNVM